MDIKTKLVSILAFLLKNKHLCLLYHNRNILIEKVNKMNKLILVTMLLVVNSVKAEPIGQSTDAQIRTRILHDLETNKLSYMADVLDRDIAAMEKARFRFVMTINDVSNESFISRQIAKDADNYSRLNNPNSRN